MYYHVVIEIKDKIRPGKTKKLSQLNLLDIRQIEQIIAVPFVRMEKVNFFGYFIEFPLIISLKIIESENTAEYYTRILNDKYAATGIRKLVSPDEVVEFGKFVEDITEEVLRKFRPLEDDSEDGD